MNLSMQFLVKLTCECNLVWLNAAMGGNNDERNKQLNVFLPRASNSLKLSLCSRTHRSNFDFPANRTRSSAAMSGSSEWALSSTAGVAFMKFARSLFSSRLMRASKASSTFFVEIVVGSHELDQQNFTSTPILLQNSFRFTKTLDKLDPSPYLPHGCPRKMPRSCDRSGSRNAR